MKFLVALAVGVFATVRAIRLRERASFIHGDSQLDALESSSQPRLFPLVQEIHSSGPCCAWISSNVRVVDHALPGSKPQLEVLGRAAGRAESVLRSLANQAVVPSTSSSDWQVERIRVSLTGQGQEVFDETTSYAYQINCSAPAKECVLSAATEFGAIAALESTFVQLFESGTASFQSLIISDWPQYSVRGLMVDAGRRFVPKEVLKEQVINGMALVRMNLLQLHLSDFCRFAVDLPGFPELAQSGLLEGQYSVGDIREIVSYARDRGIRVVPEVDLPGHASGLLALKGRGLHFCESTKGEDTLPEEAAKVFDDPGGQSRAVLKQLLSETAAAFGDQSWFHVGGDEVSPGGSCTQDNVVQLEEFVTRDVVEKSLGKTPIGWGEVLLKNPEEDGERAAGDSNRTVLVAWQGGAQVREVLRRGHRVIAAAIGHHYLDVDSRERPASNFWYDLASTYGINARSTESAGLLGGISAMWMDRYCYAYQCGAAGETIARRVGSRGIPVAPMMFMRKYDDSFGESIAGMIWPRAGVTAAALWRYDSKMEESDLAENVAWLAGLLRNIPKVASCPAHCDCDEVSACGQPYSAAKQENSGIALVQNVRWHRRPKTPAALATAASSLERRMLNMRRDLKLGTSDSLEHRAGLASKTTAVHLQVDTYVINMATRKDRCSCMQQVLVTAPQAVYRQAAVDKDACGLRSDMATLYGNRNHTAEQSLFCSNFKVWERARNSSADFIVIMEDDVVLKPGFWKEVQSFIQNCSDFDYVSMDSWKADGKVWPDRVAVCQHKTQLFKPNKRKYLDYWGTHVQLIRKSFLETLIARAQLHGMGPMDVWWMMRINDGRSFSWQPGLAVQAGNGKGSVGAPRSCSPSVVGSDINPVFAQGATPARLDCM